MSKYNHRKIEAKWQKIWDELEVNKSDDKSKKPKSYILDMFPYTSADGLHVGHPKSYTATDIISRYKRAKGFEVLHPFGWDSFGLPTENKAIKEQIYPKELTKKYIERFRKQVQSLGFSYDWSREINTSSPEYYRWTQWLFLELYKNGLAYKKKAPVNWCPSCQTVLANEQVVDGKCERCQTEVVQKNLSQWFFKVSKYTDELLEGLDKLDWPESLKASQRNWIGKSDGALIKFRTICDCCPTRPKESVVGCAEDITIPVFTTRPDTIAGATYLVLAPESEIILNLKLKANNIKEIEDYTQKANQKTELERITPNKKQKTGVELTGVKVINPLTKKEMSVWIADYVLGSYGTGAIMAVPAHDQRDWEFAKKYDLPNLSVIANDGELPNADYGTIKDSDSLNGLIWPKDGKKIISMIPGAKPETQYRLRDWLVSRQRYWGTPIPIIYCNRCFETKNNQTAEINGKKYAIHVVAEKDLPVELPDDVDFLPTGESPLARSKSFHEVRCPSCGATGKDVVRESDTLDTFVCSSWYYLRYTDPLNSKIAFDKAKAKHWLPVDIYIGGAEHAVLHMLYSRFITKALCDLGYLEFDEPFTKVVNQGLILAQDGRKMSKSLGNVISPDTVVEEYGADTLRLYEMFMGPLEDTAPWDTMGIVGIRRFLDRVWNAKSQDRPSSTQKSNTEQINKTILKVSSDIENLKFNTAISALMEYVNGIYKNGFNQKDFESFLVLLSPFAPHLTAEIWEKSGHSGQVWDASWPVATTIDTANRSIKIAVQINGRVRATIEVTKDVSEDVVLKLAKQNVNIKKHLGETKILKHVYIPSKILNLVI